MLIREKVKVVEPYRFENLHGHVTIDLHNHKSGFTERVAEGDNLVTDAIQNIINAYAVGGQVAPSTLFPIATNLLGGVMIFDGPLTEDPSNCEFPSEAHYVGGAGDTANGSSTVIGTRNNTESGRVTNGYKTVWDFSTSQANGEIGSLARTLVSYGNGLLADHAHARATVGYQAIGFTTDGYSLNTNGTKTRIYLDRVPVMMEGISYEAPVENAIKTPPASVWWDFDQRTGIAYSTSNGDTWYKYDSNTDEFTKLDRKVSGMDWKGYPLVCEGYLIARNGGTKTFVRAPLNNIPGLIEYEELDITLKGWNDNAIRRIGNAALVPGTTNDSNDRSYLLYPDGVAKCLGQSPQQALFVAGDMSTIIRGRGLEYSISYSNNGSRGVRPANGFLGTIFNLDEIVTKTASQSMKITYTLTNE